MRDSDLIVTLQAALDAAQQRLRAADRRVEELNLQLTAANERRDELESALWCLAGAPADGSAAQSETLL